VIGPPWTALHGAELQPNCNRRLSAWEVSSAICGLRAETLICGILARLATSDRESPLLLTRSGT